MSNIRSSENSSQFHRGENGRGLVTQGYDDHRKSKRQLDGNSFERDISSSEDGDDADDNSAMDIGNQSNERTMMHPRKNISSVQASYQFDRLREDAEDGNPKSKISSYTLKQPQRYVPMETFIDRIGSYSLNPSTDTHYIDSGDDSSMEDQSDEYSDESSMEELDKGKISSYALSEPVIRRHCIWFPPSVRAIIVGKSGSGKTTL